MSLLGTPYKTRDKDLEENRKENNKKTKKNKKKQKNHWYLGSSCWRMLPDLVAIAPVSFPPTLGPAQLAGRCQTSTPLVGL